MAFRHIYDLAKRVLRTESLDAGWRVAAYDAAAAVLEQRDGKDALVLHAYDVLGRLNAVWARDGTSQSIRRCHVYVYGDDPGLPLTADQRRERNLLGRLSEQRDDAGVVIFARYDLKGAVLSKSRRAIADAVLLAVYANPGASGEITPFRIDWDNPPPAPFLEPALETGFLYDALGRIVQVIAPAISSSSARQIRPRYNKAGALEHVEVEDTASGARQIFVEHIAYNAKGQRTLIAYGNRVLTRYAYDPNTFRLVRLRSERFTRPDEKTFAPAGGLLQELGYAYDLAGNVLSITDRTPGCGVINNPDGGDLQFDAAMRASLAGGDALVRRFTYDATYRLISAMGREAKSISGDRAIPESRDWFGFGSGNHGSANQDNAPTQTALYTETYAYDAVGNMTKLMHRAGGAQWARYCGMDGYRPQEWAAIWPSKRDATTEWISPPSNRLTNFGLQADAGPSHAYDANGNLISETTSRHFEWDYADRLRAFRVQLAGAAPSIHAQYLYDEAGQRVKKLIRNGQRGWEATIYLDGLIEVQRVSDANGLVETSELHVMDGQHRIALARLGPALPGDGAAAHAVKFHLADHLGSSALAVSLDGGWINREEYFPYGECSLGSFQRKRYRFTGKERDEESGLNYHGARYYAASIPRWISADPVAAEPNLFKCLACNPLRYIDPDGRQVQQLIEPTPPSGDALARALARWGHAELIPGGGGEAAPVDLLAGGSLAVTAAIIAGIFYYSYQTNPMAKALDERQQREGLAHYLYQNGVISYEAYLVVLSGGQLPGIRSVGEGDVTGSTSKEGASSQAQQLASKRAEQLAKNRKIGEATETMALWQGEVAGLPYERGQKTLKDASGKTAKAKPTPSAKKEEARKPDIVLHGVDEITGNPVATGIEVKASYTPSTQATAEAELAKEQEMENQSGGVYWETAEGDSIPWCSAEGSGVIYGPGVLQMPPPKGTVQ